MNLDDDDFPVHTSSTKLASLFDENAAEDVSFHYVPQSQAKPRSQTKPQPPPLAVLIGFTVDAFQLKKGGYSSEGKLGLVILGNDEISHYKVYMYRNDENKVASSEITPNFTLQVQENNYVSFQDSNSITWSLHFDKASSLTSFCREIALTKWKSGRNKLSSLKQDGLKGASNHTITNSDKVEINFSLFTINNNKIGEKCLSCTREAAASSNVWPMSPVGKCLDSKFFMIAQNYLLTNFDLPYGPKQVILVEMEIKNVIKVPERPPKETMPLEEETVQKSENEESKQLSKISSDKSEENAEKNLSERMMKIGFQLPTFQPEPETEQNNLRTSSKHSSITVIKDDQLTTTPSELSFDFSMNSQFNVFLSEVRISNSELRMNLNRVTDKVDSLIHKVESNEETNSKWKSFVDRVSSLEDSLSTLIDQNVSALTHAKKEPPIVSEVAELTRKNSELEGSLKIANDAIKSLEEKVEKLQNQITDFTQKPKESEKLRNLENKNDQLSRKIYSLSEEKKQKEIYFTSALRDKENLILELKQTSNIVCDQLKHYEEKELMDRDLNVWIKKVLKWADKSLKIQLQEIIKNDSLDHVVSQTLMEVANEFYGRFSSSDDSIVSKNSDHDSLPKPKPRHVDKKTDVVDNLKRLNNNDSNRQNVLSLPNELPPLPTINEDESITEDESEYSKPEKDAPNMMWKEEPPPISFESDDSEKST